MPDGQPIDFATPDDIREAISALSKADHYRIYKAARFCLWGTGYADPQEIINEAILRTMKAASGEKGRHWPKDVPFVSYVIMTMQGLADDSRESVVQKKTDYMEAMAAKSETDCAEDVLGRHGHYHPDHLSRAVENEETRSREEQAKKIVDKIDEHFKGDDEVNWIIMGHKDGMGASEIRDLSGMTKTQYETARRRFRRGLDKLFPKEGQP